MIIIARHQEGISLNPYEFILNEDGYLLKFLTEDDALHFLNQASGVEYSKEDWVSDGIYFLNEEEF